MPDYKRRQDGKVDVDYLNETESLLSGLHNEAKEKLELIKTKISDMITYIKELPAKIWNKMKELGTIIGKAIKNALPSFSRRTDEIDDGIVKPNGQVIKTDPNDTIFATKNPSGMFGGGGNTINFYGLTMDEAIEKAKKLEAEAA